jgi:anti-sigma28 factor (negative regulator of flagellin synthesis)
VKINESDVLNIQKPQSGKVPDPVKTSRTSRSTERSGVSQNDGIDLGSQSGLLTYTREAGATEREERVRELRAQVQSGQYQVDSFALSHSIIGATANGY